MRKTPQAGWPEAGVAVGLDGFADELVVDKVLIELL